MTVCHCSDTWVTFPEVPVFSIAVRPLKALNVMRLPLLSSYVHHAVADVISQFLAPKAYHLDVARLIMVGAGKAQPRIG